MSSSASSAGAGHSAAGTGAHSDDGAAVSSSAGAAPPLPPSLPPLLAGLPPLTDLPPEARKVTQYLPPALLPLLGAPLDSVFFALLLLPTVFAIDELGRTEWFVRSRCRLLADPVASAGYRCGQHSLTGLRRPAELTAAVLRAGPLVAPAAAPGAPPPPRRLLDTATVRVLFARKAKRLRGVMLPARNWETTRGLEERARLVECAVTEEVFMLNPVSLKSQPDYLTRLPRRPLALVDLHKALSLANSEWNFVWTPQHGEYARAPVGAVSTERSMFSLADVITGLNDIYTNTWAVHDPADPDVGPQGLYVRATVVANALAVREYLEGNLHALEPSEGGGGPGGDSDAYCWGCGVGAPFPQPERREPLDMGPLQGCVTCGRCFHPACHAEHVAQIGVLAARAASNAPTAGSSGSAGAGSEPATPTASSAAASAPATRGAAAGRFDAAAAAAAPGSEWTCADCVAAAATAAVAAAPAARPATATGGICGVTTTLAQRAPLPPGVRYARLRPPQELLVPPGDVCHWGVGERALLTVVHPPDAGEPIRPTARRPLMTPSQLTPPAIAAGVAPTVSSSAPVSYVIAWLQSAAAAATYVAGVTALSAAAAAAVAGKKRPRPASDVGGGSSKSAPGRGRVPRLGGGGGGSSEDDGPEAASAPSTARGGGGGDGSSDADDRSLGRFRAPLEDTIAAAFSRRGGFASEPMEAEAASAVPPEVAVVKSAQLALAQRELGERVRAAVKQAEAAAAAHRAAVAAAIDDAAAGGPPPDVDALTDLFYGDDALPTLRHPDMRRPRILRVRFVPRGDVPPGASMPGPRRGGGGKSTRTAAAAATAASYESGAADYSDDDGVWRDAGYATGAAASVLLSPSLVVVERGAPAPGAPPTPASRTGSALLVDWTDPGRGLVAPSASSASSSSGGAAGSRQPSAASSGGGTASQESNATVAALLLGATSGAVGRGASLVGELLASTPSSSSSLPPLMAPVRDGEHDGDGGVGGPAPRRQPPPGGSEGGGSEPADAHIGSAKGKPAARSQPAVADGAPRVQLSGGGGWQ